MSSVPRILSADPEADQETGPPGDELETREESPTPKEEVDFFTIGWPKGRTPTFLNKDYSTFLLRGPSCILLFERLVNSNI